MELLLAGHRLLLLFPLAQNRSSFLGLLSQRRASLEGLKMVALPQTCRPCARQGEDHNRTEKGAQPLASFSSAPAGFYRVCVCLQAG